MEQFLGEYESLLRGFERTLQLDRSIKSGSRVSTS